MQGGIEAGFGSSLGVVLPLAPNISDLWLTLNLRGKEKVSQLTRQLPKMNPRRVILHEGITTPSTNQVIRDLTIVLVTCIRDRWHKLVSSSAQSLLSDPYR